MSSRSSDWFTRARHLFYGAATALVEILQDPEKRAENLNRLSMDLAQLAAELEQKGELIEQEAVRYVESLRDPAANAPAAESERPAPAESAPPTTASPAPISKEEMAELMELIHQIESLRLDLERLRTEPPSASS
ncbi:hypothetical protein NW845_04335 [Synechococcus sp. H60.2]|uniref:hypothetical protein n=1 Tax=Synechococcus sp. H60.2 TaxID=2964518 RepID=UPI0039C072B9